MKTALLLIVSALVGASGARATTITLPFQSVNPQGTFLYQAATDNCTSYSLSVTGCNNSPTFINLTPYIGDTITVTDVGSICVTSGTNCTIYPAYGYLGAIFASSPSISSASNQDRVTDSFNTGLMNITSTDYNSWADGTNTTIPNDFYLPVTNLVVPATAPYLIVGVLDSFYSDNSLGNPSSPGYTGEFGVDITVNLTNTPEPATAALLLTGIGGLWAFRRKFVKQA